MTCQSTILLRHFFILPLTSCIFGLSVILIDFVWRARGSRVVSGSWAETHLDQCEGLVFKAVFSLDCSVFSQIVEATR